MSAVPAAAAVPLRLRVAIVAADQPTARRLADLIALSSHAPVDPAEAADAVLTDGSAAALPGLPIVALGTGEGDFAGLLPADAGPAQLDAALRAVAAGLTVRPPSPPPPGFAPLPEEPSPALTPREVEVLTALAEALGNKAVARRLHISPHTVKFHIESLFRKLGAATRAEAVAKGLRRQIVEF
jgi:two-component system, NarL family, nitrate/nitrite response regulator NarL